MSVKHGFPQSFVTVGRMPCFRVTAVKRTRVFIDLRVVRSNELKHPHWSHGSYLVSEDFLHDAASLVSISLRPCQSLTGLEPGTSPRRSRHPGGSSHYSENTGCTLAVWAHLFELSQACCDWQGVGTSFEILLDMEGEASEGVFFSFHVRASWQKLSLSVFEPSEQAQAHSCARATGLMSATWKRERGLSAAEWHYMCVDL